MGWNRILESKSLSWSQEICICATSINVFFAETVVSARLAFTPTRNEDPRSPGRRSSTNFIPNPRIHDRRVRVYNSSVLQVPSPSKTPICHFKNPFGFRSVFSTPKSVQATVTLLENLHIILEKTPRDDIRSEVLPMLYSAFESTTIQVQVSNFMGN